ncbi:THAP domain-containing protein 1 [Nymphon striatum]|nr:THAP domain-containing protein 1 [Nymphon striatum]
MGFKCAAFGCNSGYKSQTSGPTVSFHMFPLNDSELLKLWQSKIQRKDYSPTENSRLCSLHFCDSWFTVARSDTNASRARSKMPVLPRRRLMDKAIPTIFPNCPSYMSHENMLPRSKNATSENRVKESNNQLTNSISQMFEADVIQNIDKILRKLESEESIPAGFNWVVKNGDLLLLYIEATSVPVRLLGCIAITSNLDFTITVNEELVDTKLFNGVLGVDMKANSFSVVRGIWSKRMKPIGEGNCGEISEVPKITGKIEILKDYLSKFELAHENYLIHIESIDETVEIHDNVDKRVEEFLEFMEKITEIIGKLIETREKTVAGNQVQIENNVNVREVINQNTSVRLPKLEIPIFDGSILKWKEFWDIFAVTIHQNSRLSDIEKFTYLKSKLTGNVNEVIAGLSLTGANYSAAVTLLCERYGDNNKIIKAHYSQLLDIPPASNNTKKLRNTYDMISNHLRSLEALEQTIDNPMYIHLIQTKLPTNILTQMELLKLDQSWSTKSLCDTLKRILNAREAAEGETKEYKNPRSLFSTNQRQNNTKCEICEGSHGAWTCEAFKRMNVQQRLLHNIKSKFTFVGQPSISNSQDIQTDEMGCEIVVPNTEGEHVHTSTLISESEPGMLVTLRTIPVILKNGSKTLKVNALLDDRSTKTYVNNDIAEELGLKGYSKNVSVNVLNGKIRVFRTTPVQFELQSVNGQVKIEIDAYTTDRVTGRLEAINWNKEKYKWPHLREIKFPYLGKRPIVDILIGLDYADLHCSLQDICGKSGEPIARLTPLGWTCIGKVKSEQADYTNFVHTYFLQNSDSLDYFVDHSVKLNLKDFP